MGKLYISAADYFDGINNSVCLFLKTFLHIFGNGKHRCGTERITGMRSHWVNVFDEADGNHIAIGVTYNFKL